MVSLAITRLGISEEIARAALGSLLGFVVQHSSCADAKELLASLPCAHALLSEARAAVLTPESIGGLHDDDIAAVWQGVEQNSPAAFGLIGSLRASGLSFDLIPWLIGLFLEVVSEHADPDLQMRIRRSVPELDCLKPGPNGSVDHASPH